VINISVSGTFFVLSGQHLFAACSRISLEKQKANLTPPKCVFLYNIFGAAFYFLFLTIFGYFRWANEFLCTVTKPGLSKEQLSAIF
jgi:hypothetical protein